MHDLKSNSTVDKAGMDFRPPSSPQKDQDRMQTCWVNTFALICIDFQLTLRDDQNQVCGFFDIQLVAFFRLC